MSGNRTRFSKSKEKASSEKKKEKKEKKQSKSHDSDKEEVPVAAQVAGSASKPIKSSSPSYKLVLSSKTTTSTSDSPNLQRPSPKQRTGFSVSLRSPRSLSPKSGSSKSRSSKSDSSRSSSSLSESSPAPSHRTKDGMFSISLSSPSAPKTPVSPRKIIMGHDKVLFKLAKKISKNIGVPLIQVYGARGFANSQSAFKRGLVNSLNGEVKNSFESEILNVIKKIPDLMKDNIEIFGANNINIVIGTHEGNKIVLQFSENREYCNDLPDLSFFVKTYAPSETRDLTLDKWAQKTEDLRSDYNTNIKLQHQVTLKFIEYLPKASLVDKLNDLHALNDRDVIIKFAAKIGLQISSLIKELVENDIIWTDMKLGNILLRDNNELVVSDTKAFLHYKDIILSYDEDKDMFYTNYESNFNLSETSPAGNDLILMYPCKREHELMTISQDSNEYHTQHARLHFRDAWYHEYKYRLGVMLYSLATNEEILTDSETLETTPFNFEHPVFETSDGQMLAELISALCDEDPSQRFSFEDTEKVLRMLDPDLVSELDAKSFKY